MLSSSNGFSSVPAQASHTSKSVHLQRQYNETHLTRSQLESRQLCCPQTQPLSESSPIALGLGKSKVANSPFPTLRIAHVEGSAPDLAQTQQDACFNEGEGIWDGVGYFRQTLQYPLVCGDLTKMSGFRQFTFGSCPFPAFFLIQIFGKGPGHQYPWLGSRQFCGCSLGAPSAKLNS